jgi:carbon-monoxide dehydrogenase medium subunit
MIPVGFDYEVAESVDHAIELLGAKEDAKLLAGGHSLLPLMKLRLARPATLVDLGRVQGLSGVRDAGDHLAIGALTRHHELEHDPTASSTPADRPRGGLVGDPQVRHRGHRRLAPTATRPTCRRALASTPPSWSRAQRRATIAAADFFNGFFDTALAEDESSPGAGAQAVGAGWSYIKFRQRALDWPTVGVAAWSARRTAPSLSARSGSPTWARRPCGRGERGGARGAPRDAVAAAARRPTRAPTLSDTWAPRTSAVHLAGGDEARPGRGRAVARDGVRAHRHARPADSTARHGWRPSRHDGSRTRTGRCASRSRTGATSAAATACPPRA